MSNHVLYTTLARLKEYIGITSDDHDVILTRMLESASVKFDANLARHSARKSRKEFFSLLEDGYFSLPGYPIKLNPDAEGDEHNFPMLVLTLLDSGQVFEYYKDYTIQADEQGRGRVNFTAPITGTVKAVYTGGMATATTIGGSDGATSTGEDDEAIFTTGADLILHEIEAGDKLTITGGENAGDYIVESVSEDGSPLIVSGTWTSETSTENEVWSFPDKGFIYDYPVLEEAITIYLQYLWKNKDRMDLGSAAIGGTNVQFIADRDLRKEIEQRLDLYRRWI